MKLIKSNQDGQITQVLNISSFDAVPDGFSQVDEAINDVDLINLHYVKDGYLRERPSMPSLNHRWDNLAESWILDIDSLRNSKSIEIEQACKLAIVSGFISWAMGAPYHYPSKVTDQQNLAASVLASYDPENDAFWNTPFWCSDSAGDWDFRSHTAAQIREVGRDAKSAILAYQYKNESLQNAISAAETAEQIAAITW